MTDASGPVELDIETVVGGGRGLAHHTGATWMVSGALPGERVSAVPTRRRAGIVEATTTAVLDEPHPARCTDPCRHAATCGGCDWPHVDPAAGAPLKAAAAAGAARAHPELAAQLAAATIRPSPLGYRLRVRLHFDPDVGRLGFYAPRSWQVSEVDDCRIVSPTLAAVRPRLEETLASSCPAPVDLEWLEDLAGDAAVAALRGARRRPAPPDPAWVPPQEVLAGSKVTGFHRLDASGNILPGWGTTTVRMELPISLEVPIGAFFQGNRHLVGWLFDRVAEVVGPDPGPTWDLHSGVGLLAAAARTAAEPRLTLVEPFRPAARAAARNLPGARVAVGRTAEEHLARARRLPRAATVIVDPPRAGLSATLRRKLAGWHPDRVVMLACDAATWARDTAFLLDRGYALGLLELVDLYPSTHHVEVLAVLEAR